MSDTELRSSDDRFERLKRYAQMQADYSVPCDMNPKVVLALVECAEALKKLSDMYASTWDRVDGALMMMGDGIERFEAAHQASRDAITKLEKL